MSSGFIDTVEEIVEKWDAIYTEDDESGASVNPFYLIQDLQAAIRREREEGHA